jgi:hypothetical protein
MALLDFVSRPEWEKACSELGASPSFLRSASLVGRISRTLLMSCARRFMACTWSLKPPHNSVVRVLIKRLV